VSQVALHEGGPADLPGVMRVMEAAFDPCFGEAWTAAQCAGLLPLPGVWLTVASAADEVAGFSLARSVADEAELLLLAVRPDLRGRGIGKCLLTNFSEAAISRGAVTLHLEVRDGNPATMLYRKAGFTVSGRRINYYQGRGGGNFDALSLSRPAAGPIWL
jgi:[ribosomal protein S18]-alanine N-acetyltransferase